MTLPTPPYTTYTPYLNVFNSTIVGNSAANTDIGQGGGGISMISGDGTILVVNSIVSGNLNSNAADILSTGAVATYYSA